MENLYIEPGIYTPEVLMQAENNTFRFTGNSYPASPEKFYQPVLDWVKKFCFTCQEAFELPIHFIFNYFNTASSKLLSELFQLFENSPMREKVTIYWHYEEDDSDMLLSGQIFNSLYKLNFVFNTKQD